MTDGTDMFQKSVCLFSRLVLGSLLLLSKACQQQKNLRGIYDSLRIINQTKPFFLLSGY